MGFAGPRLGRAALAVVMGDGPTIGVGILSPAAVAGFFGMIEGVDAPGRPPVNSAAMPEARFPGRWVVAMRR